MTKRTRTDPACIHFKMPTTRLGYWLAARRVDARRGYPCHECVPPLQRPDVSAVFHKLIRS